MLFTNQQLEMMGAISLLYILDAQLTHGETCFVYTGGLSSCPQHIRDIGDIIACGYSLSIVEEAGNYMSRSSHARKGQLRLTKELSP